MKTFYFTSICALLLMLVSTSSFSQTGKGGFIVGGTGNLGRTTFKANDSNPSGSYYDNLKRSDIGTAPQLYFLPVENFAVGLISTSQWTRTNSENMGVKNKNRSRLTDLGPSVRYYFPFGKWAIFPEANYTWGRESTKNESIPPSGTIHTTTHKMKTETLGIHAGLVYFISPMIGMEGKLGFTQRSYRSESHLRRINNLGFQLGFQVYLAPKENKGT